jgi:hypothetical protein
MAFTGPARRGFSHWFNEMLRCQPMIAAARLAGDDLLSRLPKPEPMSPSSLRLRAAILLGIDICPREEWPSRNNLEV